MKKRLNLPLMVLSGSVTILPPNTFWKRLRRRLGWV